MTNFIVKRKDYNRTVIKKCVELLKSHDFNDVCDGAVMSAYLIEQVFKLELKKINPLLYFDRKSISDDMEIRIALGNLSEEECGYFKTISAKRCVMQMCECKKDLKMHKANFEELFNIRNFILHSVDNFIFERNKIAETSVSALRVCQKYIKKYSGISSSEFNPLTSDEFNELHKRELNKRMSALKKILKEHKENVEAYGQQEIDRRINIMPETDNCTWIEETFECPACGYSSFDKIGAVDFDWNPDGIIEGCGFGYSCRVCGLDLSEYEYELVN